MLQRGTLTHNVNLTCIHGQYVLYRAVFRDNHRGMTLLLRFVDGVIMSHTGLPKEDSMELIERVDVTLLSSELHKTELDFLTDTLKSIFNITLNWKEEGSYNEVGVASGRGSWVMRSISCV